MWVRIAFRLPVLRRRHDLFTRVTVNRILRHPRRLNQPVSTIIGISATMVVTRTAMQTTWLTLEQLDRG
jgi:hypothetical protein